MKLLLALLALLPLAGSVSAPVDDPPPFECPFCGGNAQLHAQVMGAVAALEARIGLAALAAFRL